MFVSELWSVSDADLGMVRPVLVTRDSTSVLREEMAAQETLKDTQQPKKKDAVRRIHVLFKESH